MASTGKLSDDRRKQLDASYEKHRENLSDCPTCKSKRDVIPTARGKPTADLIKYAEEGHVKLGDCTEDNKGWCKKCETYL